MAQTTAQLIAAGQNIYDQTEDDSVTQQMVGDAILQIPTLMQVVLDLSYQDIISSVDCATEFSLLQYTMNIGGGGLRFPIQFIPKVYGYAPVYGVSTAPNPATLALLVTGSASDDAHDLAPHAYSEYVSEYGALDPDNNQYVWVIPALVDPFGRELRFRPRNGLVYSEL